MPVPFLGNRATLDSSKGRLKEWVLEIARCDQRPQEYNDPQDEVANTAAFLASEHAGAITGAVANLTGGMSID